MKILHLEASSGWGGQEIRILKESVGLKEKGHTIILAVMKGGALIERARKKGFQVYEVDFRKKYWPFSFFKLIWIIQKHKIDLVNTHSSLDSWLGGIAARFMRRKIVRTRHLSTSIKPGLNSKLLYKVLADFVVTTCSSIIPMIVKQSGRSIHTCKSVATGVDPNQIKVSTNQIKEFRQKYKIDEDDFLVGTACFMRSWKGIDDFLHAANFLRDHPKLKWIIIGGGHAEKHKKLAQKLNLKHLVIFTDHLENPYPAIGALNLFALLSTAHEGISQAILQAAYLKKPLLATQIGGLNEVCIDGVTGMSVSPFSPNEVAKKVLLFQSNPAQCKEFGEKSYQLVKESFTINNTIEQMQNIFLSLGSI